MSNSLILAANDFNEPVREINAKLISEVVHSLAILSKPTSLFNSLAPVNNASAPPAREPRIQT